MVDLAMTTRPPSHLIHSGLLDIVSLIPPPRPQARVSSASPGRRDVISPSPKRQDKRASAESPGLRKRKVDKGMIGPPTDFRHIFHASTYEEATELLLRWAVEGVDHKVGDPSWAVPIKDLVKARAKEQQARAVAQVVEATARSRMLGKSNYPLQPAGTLHVVNGLPSSIYSMTNASISPITVHASHRPYGSTSLSPGLAEAETPVLIAKSGYFDLLSSSSAASGDRVEHKVPPTPKSPLPNPFDTPPKVTRPLQVRKKSVLPPPSTKVDGGELLAIQKELDETVLDAGAADKSMRVLPTPPTSPPRASRGVIKRKPAPPSHSSSSEDNLPFRVIKPSLPTLEKATSVALYFESFYHSLLGPAAGEISGAAVQGQNYLLARAKRSADLERSFASPENRFMSEGEKRFRRDELTKEENRILRERRKRVDAKAFEMGRVIGHGAFGVVRIAREKQSGRLVAMKQLRKADMLRKSQEGHVKAEKDLLAAASSAPLRTSDGEGANTNSWIVQLHYAFQDVDHLYLVLEYMAGGDLLNLLVDRDTFSEPMTRFYVAEMVLALQATHALGFVHRDIKPDNFLFTPQGHIRISDFGLATDLHWAHDTGYYEAQRKALLKKHGLDLDWATVKGGKQTWRMKKEEIERIMGKEWMDEGKGLLTWREGNRKKLAYSICGTNSYMAPEVIRGQGYGFSCDWWSLGIIMYEALYGYPPFVSTSRHVTRQKILNWRTTLKFPPAPRLSSECTDLLVSLLCEPEDRLGSSASSLALSGGGRRSVLSVGKTGLGLGKGGNDGAEAIKRHPWFKGVDWDNLHKQTPPYVPELAADDDTRYFDEDIPDEPLAPAAPGQVKDPLLRDTTHGPRILEIRKQLAFKGWTFKSPSSPYSRPVPPYFPEFGGSDAEAEESVYGHCHGLEQLEQDLSHMKDDSGETVTDGTLRGPGGTMRSRALSF